MLTNREAIFAITACTTVLQTPTNTWFSSASLSLIAGAVSLAYMGFSCILASRWGVIEKLYGGLDRMYETHKWLGVWALVFATYHFIFKVRGRRIKRYPEDEARLALQAIMTHPGAQAVFRQRKAWVEPVFSSLRQQQGLSRFRRRGLAGVKHEFALHVLAYNLARAVALSLCCFLWGHWLGYQPSFGQTWRRIVTIQINAIESSHR